jgi:MFS family permease
MLLWAVLIQAIAAVGVGVSDSFWLALIFFLIMMGATGVTQPVAQAYMHEMIPGKERATIISFNSMFSSIGSVIGQTSLGRIAQTRSIASGYVFGGLFTLLAVPVLVSLRHIEGTVDQFDEQAGSKSACAAQGLPGVSAVDSGAPSV